MSNPRERIADRMMLEMEAYLVEGVFPGLELSEETWAAMDEQGRGMVRALGAFERGEISYAELEAVGVRYVEGWEGVACS